MRRDLIMVTGRGTCMEPCPGYIEPSPSTGLKGGRRRRHRPKPSMTGRTTCLLVAMKEIENEAAGSIVLAWVGALRQPSTGPAIDDDDDDDLFPPRLIYICRRGLARRRRRPVNARSGPVRLIN